MALTEIKKNSRELVVLSSKKSTITWVQTLLVRIMLCNNTMESETFIEFQKEEGRGDIFWASSRRERLLSS